MAWHARHKWYVRPLAALLLLTAEYLAISFSFDAQLLLERAGAWESLGWTGLLGPAVITFGTALWILGGKQLRVAFSRGDNATLGAASLVRRVLFHFVCFLAFFAITARVFGDDVPREGPPGLWILLWALGAVATALSWVPLAAGDLRLRPLGRELVAPLAQASLLAMVAWGAGLATLGLWEHLGTATLNTVAALLGVLTSPIYLDASEAVVGTEKFWVQVAPVCSGYEGIGLIVVFLSAFLVAFRDRFRFPHTLLLVLVAIVAVWLFNAVRIVILILIGHAGYPDIALGGFHSKAGWLFFCAVALCAVWASDHIRWFAKHPAAPQKTLNPSAPFLLPLLAVIATALVTGLLAQEFDYLYPLRVVAGLLVLVWYRKDYTAGLEHHLRRRRLLSWQVIGIGVAVYVVWIGVSSLDSVASEARPQTLSELATPLMLVWIIGRLLGSVLVAPLVEELAFRGFLLRRLIGSDFTKVSYDQWSWSAALVSSVAFAALHQNWVGGFVAGMAYAYAQKRRGLLSDAVLAHAVTNTLISMQVLLAGHWSLW